MREGVAVTRVASAMGTPRDSDSEMQSLCQLSPKSRSLVRWDRDPGPPAPPVWPQERSLQKPATAEGMKAGGLGSRSPQR